MNLKELLSILLDVIILVFTRYGRNRKCGYSPGPDGKWSDKNWPFYGEETAKKKKE